MTATGSVTIDHAGAVVVQANLPGNAGAGQSKVGDFVYRGDVVQTGADGKVGITFTDGTAFNLSSNARMVLNEFVYDPNGKSNSTLFSLSKGTFTFIAGKVAKTGDMKIDTPVATMGIRGTTPHVEISDDGTVKFSTLIEENKGRGGRSGARAMNRISAWRRQAPGEKRVVRGPPSKPRRISTRSSTSTSRFVAAVEPKSPRRQPARRLRTKGGHSGAPSIAKSRGGVTPPVLGSFQLKNHRPELFANSTLLRLGRSNAARGWTWHTAQAAVFSPPWRCCCRCSGRQPRRKPEAPQEHRIVQWRGSPITRSSDRGVHRAHRVGQGGAASPRHRLQQPWQRLNRKGRVRPRHPGLQSVDQARSQQRQGLQQPRRGLPKKARVRPRDPRL